MASPARIAIIDDDTSLREALIALVRSVGHVGTGHGSAEDFLESGEAGAADCLITDIRLPGLSGVDLALQLRAASTGPPVVIITARTETALLARAAQSGALCVLRKPFAADDLLDCLERALADR
ncbi:response regulator [Caulobacter flavus]|uniref:Response regulator n=1 Tax=Caulobacter flavus TaxID=1679497 RepID=A0A2N5CKY9_9CAUL|nr:response regulator [Caulobacter flavus]AYV46732.1 response regulator [Caulobacter flavus]PLR06345.1 response regulator [Caulobacter flavus]